MTNKRMHAHIVSNTFVCEKEIGKIISTEMADFATGFEISVHFRTSAWAKNEEIVSA